MGEAMEWLAGRSRTTLVLLGAIGCGVVALLDYLSGYVFNVVLLYVFPILGVTWAAGLGAGILLATLSALASFLAQASTAPPSLPLAVHLWNTAMRFGVFAGGAWILTSLRRAAEQAVLANVDPLTGLANVRAFEALVKRELLRARRYRHPLTVAYLDLDGFKALNDTLGHPIGDEVLRHTATVLLQNLRDSDVIARVGGDEFVMVLPETDFGEADQTLRRLREKLAARMKRRRWPVTFSIGAVSFALPPPTVRDLVGPADRLMYRAKRSGGNTLRHAKTVKAARRSRDVA